VLVWEIGRMSVSAALVVMRENIVARRKSGTSRLSFRARSEESSSSRQRGRIPSFGTAAISRLRRLPRLRPE